MGINHRRTDVAMPEQLLHRTDVVTALQQVRRERMAQRVRRHRFGDAGALRGAAHGPLHALFIDMVAPPRPAARVERKALRNKYVLPSSGLRRTRVFARQRMRQIDLRLPVLMILLVPCAA